MMRRREVIAGLGGAAVWPLAAGAQQPALPLVGWLGELVINMKTAKALGLTFPRTILGRAAAVIQ